MARCPDCNKFVSLDSEADPEVNDISISDDGTVSLDVHIANSCQECGTEMFTADLQGDVASCDITDAAGTGLTIDSWLASLTEEGKATVQFEVEEDGASRTDRYEGKGRGQRHFYGAEVQFVVTATVTVPTGAEDDSTEEKEVKFNGTYNEDIQASSMDQAY